MSTAILACRILEDEVRAALAASGLDAPVFWLEASLHLRPERLRAALQEHLNDMDGVRRFLFTFGLCGNSIIGLNAPRAELIIPLRNDCIGMLLQPPQPFAAIKGCYFLTPGWVRDERSLAREVDYYYARYGEARSRRILKIMLQHYSYLAVLDTKAYDLEAFLPQARDLAARLGLGVRVCGASVDLLERLFRGALLSPEGRWDADFLRVPPGTPVSEDFFQAVAGGGLVNEMANSRVPERG